MPGRGQRIVESADVDLGPTVIIGGDNVDGEGDREEPDEGEEHDGTGEEGLRLVAEERKEE